MSISAAGAVSSHTFQPIAAVSKPEAAEALARPITRGPPARWQSTAGIAACREISLPRRAALT
jgi:hypothetical protein